MTKTLLVSMALIFSAVVYAEACSECLATYNRDWSACQGDTICQKRADERYEACKIGCT